MTREELGLRIKFESAFIVLMTASIFVFAGSLWAHFALSESFLNPAFFILWLLLHFQPIVCLFRERLIAPLSILAFTTLQLYFYVAFYRLEMPFVPLAPIFFVVTASTLPLFRLEKKWTPWVFWLLAWASVLFWVQKGTEAQLAQIYLPMGIAFAISAIVQASFFLLMHFAHRRLSRDLQDFGPKNMFDEQRIQAAKLQSMGELTASLLHEINNPLTNINGYSHQLAEALKEDDPQILEILKESNERILFNVDRIKDITAAVRRLLRPSRHSKEENLSVKELINDALTLTKHHIKAAGIELHVEFDAQDCRVVGNFTELSQILVNLISNARDAVEGSDTKRISLGFHRHQSEVTLWVQDSGSGIDSQLEGEVFKAFFSTKTHREGTGLGLYISKLISERNQAQLNFETLYDRTGKACGTCFKLSLRVHCQESQQAA